MEKVFHVEGQHVEPGVIGDKKWLVMTPAHKMSEGMNLEREF